MKTIRNANYSLEHTKQRFLERYGEELSDEEYDEICNIIKEGKQTVLIHKEKGNLQRTYYVKFKSKRKMIKAVWHTKLKYVKTVLPMDKEWEYYD